MLSVRPSVKSITIQTWVLLVCRCVIKGYLTWVDVTWVVCLFVCWLLLLFILCVQTSSDRRWQRRNKVVVTHQGAPLLHQSSIDDCGSIYQAQPLANHQSTAVSASLSGGSLSDSAHTALRLPINDDDSSLSTACLWINTSWTELCQ